LPKKPPIAGFGVRGTGYGEWGSGYGVRDAGLGKWGEGEKERGGDGEVGRGEALKTLLSFVHLR